MRSAGHSGGGPEPWARRALLAALAAGAQSGLPLDADVRAFVVIVVVVVAALPWVRGRPCGGQR